MSSYAQQLQRALSDPERLEALSRTELLDSPPEVAFDRLTQLATRLTNAPISLVSLVAEEYQFFKSTAGLPEALSDIRQTPLSHSFCQHAVASGVPLIVEDTRIHDVVKNVASIKDFGIHTYLGIPIKTPADHTLGTLCVLGFEPRPWTEENVQTMRELAEIAMTEVALRQELRLQLELREAIRVREAQYRSVVEGIHDVVFRLDAEGHLAFANPAWESVMERTLSESVGRHINALLPRDEIHGNPLEALYIYAFSGQTYRTHMPAADGTMKWLEIRVQQQTEAPGFTGVITDVTNNYRVEAENEARQQAERHLRLKEALLSNMSHEIRTPVSAIMSSSEILHAEVDPSLQDFTEMILDGGARLLSTLDNLLLYAQIQSNNIEPAFSNFDVMDELGRIVALLNPSAVLLEINGPDTLSIESDHFMLKTILKCLIDNAVKFTEQGKITIQVTVDDDRFTIAVQDTGIGIAEDYKTRLFAAFEQADQSLARPYEGTGLGLTLTKFLVDMLGGTITVESQLGAGSTFEVRFPLKPG